MSVTRVAPGIDFNKDGISPSFELWGTSINADMVFSGVG
jgi:hypothetical protein